MKKILSLLVILIIAFSCSRDDSEEHSQYQFPTNLTVDLQSAQVGDILTISGNGFSTSETYIVTFAENQIATITEKGNNYLKVEVPENAVSGNITLTFNNQTEIIRSIIIDVPITEFRLFASISNIIVSVDANTGIQNQILDLEQNVSIRNLVFDNTSNTIYGVAPFDSNGPVEENRLYKINLNDNTFDYVNLQNGVYYELVMSNEGNLFASVSNIIVSIDKNTGTQNQIVDLGQNVSIRNLVFDNTSNTIYGVAPFDSNGPVEENRLYKINLNDNTFDYVNLQNGVYYELAISNEGNLFASVSNIIVSIDKNTGTQNQIVDLGQNVSIRNLVFDNTSNTIYGVAPFDSNGPVEENRLYKINLNDNTFNYVNLQNGVYYELAK